jgi:hypothetical protein
MFPDERVENRNDLVSYIAYKVSQMLENHKLGEMNLMTSLENASGYIALHHHCCCIPPVDMCAGSKSLLFFMHRLHGKPLAFLPKTSSRGYSGCGGG